MERKFTIAQIKESGGTDEMIEKLIAIADAVDPYIRIILRYYNISIEELRSKKRVREYTTPRQMVCYWSFIKKESMNTIGRMINRSHCTVLYGRKTIRNLSFSNREIRDDIKYFEINLDYGKKDYIEYLERLDNLIDKKL